MSRIPLAVAALAVAVSACSKDASPTAVRKPTPINVADYEIRLERPSKVGERREVQLTATLAKAIESSAGGKNPLAKSDKYEVFFKGKIRTLAVDGRQRESKVEIAVDRLILKQGDGSQDNVLDSGAVVIGELGEGTTNYRTAAGAELGEAGAILAPKLFPLHTPVPAQLFSTKARQPVGGRWPLDKDAVRKTLKMLAPDVLPEEVADEQLAGGGQLLRALKVDGVECLEIQFSIVVELAAARNPPKGMKGAPSSYQFTVTETCPVTNSAGPLRKVTQAKIRTKFQGVPGTLQEGTTIDLQATELIDEKIKYLP